MILCNPKMRNDFNATAAHVRDMVNQTPKLKNPPGRQVSAMGRGGEAAVALTAEDAKAAADVVGADMTVAADGGSWQ